MPTPTPVPITGGFTWFTTAIDVSLAASSAAWQDIDLSTHIPTGATGAIIELVNTGTSSTISGAVRGKEDTRDYMSNNKFEEFEGETHRWQVVKVDSSRFIQGFIENTAIDFKLLGYTSGSDPLYFTTPPDVTPGTPAAWTTVDVSANVDADADGVILFVDNIDAADRDYGIREVGSSFADTSRELEEYGSTMYLVGLNAAKQFEAYVETTNVKVYLVAQTKGSVGYFTNDTTVSDPILGSYQEIDADNFGVPAVANGLVLYVTNTTGNSDVKLNVRHGDSADDWNGDIGGGTHLQAATGINANNVWDENMGGSGIDVFIGAYTRPPP